MQGNPQVIDYFKDLLRGELAARDQYFAHSRIYEDQGFIKLYTRLDHEMQEETQHADALLRRILFLGGRPDMRPKEFTPGETVPEMLRKDLATEYEVRAAGPVARHRGRPCLLARKTDRPDRQDRPAELPAITDLRLSERPHGSRAPGAGFRQGERPCVRSHRPVLASTQCRRGPSSS
jgi:hypothetical protein